MAYEYTVVGDPEPVIFVREARRNASSMERAPEFFFKIQVPEGSLYFGPGAAARGGTSGVGIAFVRLVKSGFKDVQVTGTTRNMCKAKALLEEGFDQVVEDRQQPPVECAWFVCGVLFQTLFGGGQSADRSFTKKEKPCFALRHKHDFIFGLILGYKLGVFLLACNLLQGPLTVRLQ